LDNGQRFWISSICGGGLSALYDILARNRNKKAPKTSGSLLAIGAA
jgi:hypothetical protein